jgi:hypothetical protein
VSTVYLNVALTGWPLSQSVSELSLECLETNVSYPPLKLVGFRAVTAVNNPEGQLYLETAAISSNRV